MSIKQFWIIILSIVPSFLLYADQFSQFAEARNILDRQQRAWAIRPCPVDIYIFGYVKGEGIYDSRQNFELREGHLLYFPLKKLPDVLGADINERGDYNEYAIQTRFDLSGRGPNIGCMESGFLIEADFFGRTDATIEGCDLRHAYLDLTSDNIDFLAGQTWHPICIPTDFPDTISFNSGIPICPYALTPQFRMVYHNNYFEILGAVIGFLGDRPFGPTLEGDKAFRDAMMPDFNILIKIKQNEDNYIGADFDVMRITPRLVSDNNFRDRNTFTALSGTIFTRISNDSFVWYNRFIYAENASIFEMIGGFGIHSVDPFTDKQTHVPLRTISFATELIWQSDIEPAIFIGWVKNIGATKTVIPSLGPDNHTGIFSLGPDINDVYRISPRIRWYLNSFIVGIEYEYTRAAYGTINTHGRVENTTPVSNNRFLFATYYVF